MILLIGLAAIVATISIGVIVWGVLALWHLYDDEPASWQAGARVPGPGPRVYGSTSEQLRPARPVPPAMRAAIFTYSLQSALDRAAVPCLAPGWLDQALRAAEDASLAGARA